MTGDPFFDAEMAYIDSEVRRTGRALVACIALIAAQTVNIVALGSWVPLSVACAAIAAAVIWRAVQSLKRWRNYERGTNATRPPTGTGGLEGKGGEGSSGIKPT